MFVPLALTNESPIAFPSSDPPHVSRGVPLPSPQRRQHLLSFRRISTPTAPTLINRPSSTSIRSNESHETNSSPNVASGSSPSRSSVAKLVHRPFSLDSKQKSPRKRRESAKLLDISRAVKRSKIIFEFYDTERTYVDGLDLIYSVSIAQI